MATVIFRGDAPEVPQVSEVEIDGYDASTTYGVTINGKTVLVAADTDEDTTADNLITALNASEIPEFAEITWAEGSDSQHVQGTADTAGKPFVAAAYTSGGAGTMDPTNGNTLTAVTTSSGPNDWNVAANWSGAAVPVDADDVWIQDTSVDILYGIDQNAVTLASLNITASYSGKIGLPYYDTSGDDPYAEYRERYLKIGTSVLNIGDKSGDFSGQVLLDLESVETAITMYGTDTSSQDNRFGAVEIINSGANSTLDMLGGSLDVAPRDDDTATIATIRQSGGSLRCSSGCTLATVTQTAGSFICAANLTTYTQRAGRSIIDGTATVGTFNLYGGTCLYRSNGTITTLNLDFDGPQLSFAADNRSRTVTDCNLKAGGIRDPNETVTWTNGVQPERGVAAVA